MITCESQTYKVVDYLSKGTFSSVYKVVDNKDGSMFAVKEEQSKPNCQFKVLREIAVLEAVKGATENDQKRFAVLYSKCNLDNSMLFVMTLFGESLSSLKRKRKHRIFSLNTGLFCSLETLECLKALHILGYIHRDVKPSNFTIGLRQNNRHHSIFIIDFSMSKRMLCSDGKIISPRSNIRFKGTVKFAPLSMHLGKDSSFKEDLESWMYMVADMINKTKLPWSLEQDLGNIERHKQEVFANPYSLFKDQEFSEIRDIILYLKKLQYVDKLDYAWVREMLRRVAKRKRCNLQPPLDWDS
uniref:non-specific serine/threonine protein kinase n=2 Tax=Meloidogyne TaxID=189290 RepID=A0A6V7VMC6_MELEN|nr:unnamed protein product [Meloidogyne enterolobii]CAD2191507.1 unnamed protein product [Meloidogyne enterolobii]